MPDELKIHDIAKDGPLDGRRYIEVAPGKYALWPEGEEPPKASKTKTKGKSQGDAEG
mgnify:FL=1